MTTAQTVWGSYQDYEGPFCLGKRLYELPSDPDFLDKVLAVVCATEGGHYDDVQSYDRCIISVGLLQLCEAAPVFGVSNLLGACAEKYPTLVDMSPLGAEFKKTAKGWRFFSPEEVVTADQQRALFFGSASVGKKGTWTDETRARAKKTVVHLASLWEHEELRTAQHDFVKARLPKYLMSTAQAQLSTEDTDPCNLAMVAGYYSFAVNLPGLAEKVLRSVVAVDGWRDMSSTSKFVRLMQALVFGTGVSIYPGRYDKIAPVLRKLFGANVPSTAGDLRLWSSSVVQELSGYDKAYYERLAKLSEDVSHGVDPMSVVDSLGKTS